MKNEAYPKNRKYRGRSKKMTTLVNVHGFNAGEEDGIFGEKTREAVIQFNSTKK